MKINCGLFIPSKLYNTYEDLKMEHESMRLLSPVNPLSTTKLVSIIYHNNKLLDNNPFRFLNESIKKFIEES